MFIDLFVIWNSWKTAAGNSAGLLEIDWPLRVLPLTDMRAWGAGGGEGVKGRVWVYNTSLRELLPVAWILGQLHTPS